MEVPKDTPEFETGGVGTCWAGVLIGRVRVSSQICGGAFGCKTCVGVSGSAACLKHIGTCMVGPQMCGVVHG